MFSKSNYESQEGAEGRTFWCYIGFEAMNTEINKNARDDLFKQLISQIQYAFVKEIQLFSDSISIKGVFTRINRAMAKKTGSSSGVRVK